MDNDPYREPVPPGHGEPENVGAIPGDYCTCGYPVWDVKRPGACPNCGRTLEASGAPRFSWTQPICVDCYGVRHPDRQPVALRPAYAEEETCVDCAAVTTDGIYYRVDPATANHPTLTK